MKKSIKSKLLKLIIKIELCLPEEERLKQKHEIELNTLKIKENTLKNELFKLIKS